MKTTVGQRLYSEALAIGGELARRAAASGLFARVDIAGSLRRGKHVFKDIDILLVPTRDGSEAEIQSFLASLADPDGLIGAGPTKVSIRHTGLQVDFRVVPPDSWPAALQHFTGSKEHNTALRSRAKTLGLKMNEYGVYDASGAALPLEDEASVYRAVGLAWIPPEIREADGEIEAAAAGELPVLVERRISAAWCTCTRRGPTGPAASRSWPAGASPAASSGCASATTPGPRGTRAACPTNACARRRRRWQRSTGSSRRSGSSTASRATSSATAASITPTRCSRAWTS